MHVVGERERGRYRWKVEEERKGSGTGALGIWTGRVCSTTRSAGDKMSPFCFKQRVRFSREEKLGF